MTETLPRTTRIARQFNGPNHSGNGGYVGGLIGARVAGDTDSATRVDLRKPPPLERDLVWRDHGDGVDLLDGDIAVASGRSGELEAEDPLVAPVSVEAARAAREAYEGYHDHPFPRCFACGSDRGPGDGLRLFSGPLPDGRMACPWTPHDPFVDADGLLAAPFMWAALDCPGGWAARIKTKPMVLARMTAALYRRPRLGEECVVIGALREVVRRKNHTATALYDADGELIGRADQIWVAIDIVEFS
ncbi:MAG: hypothetical protein ACRDO7_14460 [Nocardioidaceae bacterium]